MTLRTLTLAACALAIAVGHAIAQPRPRTTQPPGQPPPATTAQPPVTVPAPGAPAAPPAPAPRREGQPINVKVELTILDQRGGAAPSRKTINVVVADGMTAVIRSGSNYTTMGRVESVPLNLDVDPQLLADGKIRLRIGLQYDLPNSIAVGTDSSDRPANLFTTQLREQLAVVVESGKSIVVSESADPVGDRRVTVEVKATILR